MAPPIGNQFWKLRAKHGRDYLFSKAEDLKEACIEYFEWCDKNPWKKTEFKEGRMRKIPTARPYTLSGLCIYLGASEAYWRNFRKAESLPEDFLSVVEWVEQTIRTQKFEGAVVGAFNSNIIARDLGLADAQKMVDDDGNAVPLAIFRLPDNSRSINSSDDGSDQGS